MAVKRQARVKRRNRPRDRISETAGKAAAIVGTIAEEARQQAGYPVVAGMVR
ncbi:MAG: hypothetical protein R3D43_12845 [Tepidamorphaceae bacterium]